MSEKKSLGSSNGSRKSIDAKSLEDELAVIPDGQLEYDGYESGVSGALNQSDFEDSEYGGVREDSDRLSLGSSKSKTTTFNPTASSVAIKKSYKVRDQQDKFKSILINSNKGTEPVSLNEKYKRTRRYDTAGKYRIGPSFITKSRLSYMDENKPAKLSVVPEQMRSLEFGLLIYLWTFTDQHDKQEIDLTFLQSLIDSGCNINCRDEYGQTILHAIVRDWHHDVALFAIKNNADVNAQDKYGRTPLHLAAALNSDEIAKLLLRHGAKIDLLTENELQTATHYAAKYNSLETLSVLVKDSGSFTQRDAYGKTALFLAAQSGSVDTAQFLLDLGAPAGVYDNDGTSCIAHLLEKMTHVAYRALNQFVITNMSLGKSEFYLGHLENVHNSKSGHISRSPLEIITVYDDHDLIMHPVVRQAIQVKWQQFGRTKTIIQLVVLLIYLLCWLVLAYNFEPCIAATAVTQPFASNSTNSTLTNTTNQEEAGRDYYQHKWVIVPEALVIIFAAFFFYEVLSGKRDIITYHRAWVEWQQHEVVSKYVLCHPTWPSDRQNMEAETERIQSTPSLAGKEKFWLVYEFVMLLNIVGIIVTRVLDITLVTEVSYLVHKSLFAVGMLASFSRLLKICLRFKYFSVFLKITGLATYSFVQVAFFYCQFYIPFVAAFWLMFGGESGREMISKNNITMVSSDLKNLESIFFHVYESSFGQDAIFEYNRVDKYMAQALISLFHLFTTFISLAVLMALITSTFTTSYNRCVAEASLLQANILIQLEKKLNKSKKKLLGKYYRNECTPLTVRTDKVAESEHRRSVHSKLRFAERRLGDIEKVIHEVEDKYLQNNYSAQTDLLETTLTNVGLFEEKQAEHAKSARADIKDLLQKQEHISRCLPKLIRAQNEG